MLRGIDAAFDKYDARAAKARGRLRKINGLAWCAQAVMQSVEEMVEASAGPAAVDGDLDVQEPRESGFEAERVAAYLDRNAQALESAAASHADPTLAAFALRLRELAMSMRGAARPALDELDRTLTVLEEKMLAALNASASEQELVELKAQADRELAPYRARMNVVQLRQVRQQFLYKRLLELRSLPRLSLFYMSHE